ncbi:MAG: calcium-binding protein [Isosphaeraceae bacterium]|nr:calcium-binding protein [Isosphaeraceae bacterium]
MIRNSAHGTFGHRGLSPRTETSFAPSAQGRRHRRWHRPRFEPLEDRIVLDSSSNLNALKGAASTLSSFAASLAAGPLNEDLPILSGGASTLGQILNLNSSLSALETSLGQINTASVAGAGDPKAELQSELGSAFTVSEVSDSQVLVTYTQNITASPSVSAATDVADFFGSNQVTDYLSKIASMSGSASVQFAPGTKVTITLGANASGLFVNPGPLFTSPDLSANLNVTGQVGVGQLTFDVNLNGTGSIDLKNVSVAINQTVSGASLGNIGQAASLSVGNNSQATLSGDFQAVVFGTPLLDWGPSISWAFASDGTPQAAQISIPTNGPGVPKFLDASSVESALTDSITGALGLSKLDVLLNPLAQAPSGLSDFIGFVTAFLQGSMDSPDLDPESGIEQILHGGSFSLASGTDLLNIVEGNSGNLITYTHPDFQFLSITPDAPTISIPAFSILGILNGTFDAALKFSFTGTAGIGIGIDTSGLFVDTTQTHVVFSADVGAGVGLGLNVAGIDKPGNVVVGPDITTTATLGLKDTTGGQDKARLGDLVSGLDFSNGLSGLGSWLQKDLDLKIDVAGSIDLTFTINTPVKGVISALPDPVANVLEPFALAYGDVIDFLSGAVETVCDIAEDVPIFGSLVKKLVNCHDVKTVAQILFGEYVQILIPLAESLGADPIKTHPSADGQSAVLVWSFPVTNFEQDLTGSQITAGTSAENNPNASDPSDFIQYSVSGGTLNITGAAGTDNVQLIDLGGGQVELLRSGVDSSGHVRTDPSRVFSGITDVNATMNDSADTNDSFTMDPTLHINATVNGGAGNETIKTGAGDDTVHGGAGADYIDGGDGTNVLYAGNGNATLIGGSGTDTLNGGPGDDLLEAGSGTETLYGGAGNDKLVAGAGTDELHGGGGNDTFVAGSGTCTMDGEGGVNDSDTFTGGSGTVTMNGGQGNNTYFCGTGTTIIKGGSGPDLIYWNSGDGNATIDGGADSAGDTIDRLQMRGAPGMNDFTASANGTGVTVAAPGATVNASNINVLNIDGTGAAGKTVINDLSGTTVQVVGLNLDEVANPDSIQSQFVLNGPTSPRTINVGEFTMQGNVVFNGTGIPVFGNVMLVTGLGPTILASNDDNDLAMNLGGGGNTIGINVPTLHGVLNVNGSAGGDTFNVQAVSGPTLLFDKGAPNTFNVGSKAPSTGGTLPPIAALLVVAGSGADTMNVDDTGATTPQSGTLTGTTLNGFGMSPSGIIYAGISTLNLNLGSGGNTLNINVDGTHDLPATTAVNGGSSTNDTVNAQFQQDFSHTLNLTAFEFMTMSVGHDFNGTLSDTGPGNIQSLTVGHAVKPSGSLTAGNITSMTVGPNALTPGDDMAGRINVTGTLTDLRVAGGTPGTITAGHIGTIRVYGGYGPIIAQIMEGGIERRIEAAIPAQPFPVAVPPPSPSPTASPAGVTVQYYYESGALTNPQLTARITNTSGNSQPDQFDLSLVVWNDRAKFNLARLDASGVSGVRNVAVEGDLLSSVSPSASAFFVLPSGAADASPGGVYLPLDRLAGVGVRDFASNGAIAAKSIQAVAFGSFLDHWRRIELGTCACESDAEQLLACGTSIVQAGSTNGQNAETFRVPFADLTSQHVAFFVATEEYPCGFDDDTIAFIVQGIDNGLTVQQNNVARGAVTALISVTRPLDKHGHPEDSIVQTIALNGDGGSIQSDQFIAQGITSTGPLGDVCVAACQGISNITAPSIFGNINTTGPIFGTIQTTGVRFDPITGAPSTVPADLGRAYVVTPSNPRCGKPYVTTTTIQAGWNYGISGQIISRGDLISAVDADGCLSGTIAAQGSIGTFSSLLGTPVRVGSVVAEGLFSGQVVALGNIIGDLILCCGMKGGEVAAKGQPIPGLSSTQVGILGNTVIGGTIDRSSALVSGGEIGDRALCTALSVGCNQGIVAAKGAINFDRWSTLAQGNAFINVGSSASTDPNAPLDAAAIDAIFTQGGQPLQFDIAPGDLAGLSAIEKDLDALSIGVNSKGRVLKGTTA